MMGFVEHLMVVREFAHGTGMPHSEFRNPRS
jgi:hypothetical protein